jgi:peptide chain release factor subunit 3
MLAKTLGVQRLVVAINKMDDETVGWSQERFDEIKKKVLPFLRSLSYRPRREVTWVPISAYTGANVKERAGDGVCRWYDGGSLLEILDSLSGFDRNSEGAMRLPVLDKFKDMGTSTVLGKVESGTIQVGDKLTLQPYGQEAEVSGIGLDTGDVTSARCGENVQLRVKGVDVGELSPGMIFCSPDNLCTIADTVEAQLAIMNLTGLFTAGFRAVLHIHTAVVEVDVHKLVKVYDKSGTPLKRTPRFVKSGAIVSCILKLERPQCLELFSDYQQLGRFTLRNEGATIAIGKITKIFDKEGNDTAVPKSEDAE